MTTPQFPSLAQPPSPIWPDGKRFAFTIFDDTDRSTLENAPPVYALLRDLGLRTTKSVWPSGGVRNPSIVGGTTCADTGYLAWVRELQRAEFEIGLHNVTYHTSTREETERGLTRFVELFGHQPRSMANHTNCREGIYWGADRVTGLHRLAYDVLTRFRQRNWFRGHIPGDPHFWGDLCRERVDYVRNFTFTDINTLRVCPFMPYHDPARTWVKSWFASSEGGNCPKFVKTINERAQDELEESGGACIMYTHFGKGFHGPDGLDPRFTELMTRLAKKRGWFVPVSTLLDHIARARGGAHTITAIERTRLERRWLAHKLAAGTS
jgi:hypothetical protein